MGGSQSGAQTVLPQTSHYGTAVLNMKVKLSAMKRSSCREVCHFSKRVVIRANLTTQLWMTLSSLSHVVCASDRHCFASAHNTAFQAKATNGARPALADPPLSRAHAELHMCIGM